MPSGWQVCHISERRALLSQSLRCRQIRSDEVGRNDGCDDPKIIYHKLTRDPVRYPAESLVVRLSTGEQQHTARRAVGVRAEESREVVRPDGNRMVHRVHDTILCSGESQLSAGHMVGSFRACVTPERHNMAQHIAAPPAIADRGPGRRGYTRWRRRRPSECEGGPERKRRIHPNLASCAPRYGNGPRQPGASTWNHSVLLTA